MHGQHWIKQMCKTDPMRLGNEPKQSPIAIEAPGSTQLNNLNPRLVVTVEKFIRHLTGRRLICQLNCGGAEPLNGHDSHQTIRENAFYRRIGEQSFQFAHENKGDSAIDSINCKTCPGTSDCRAMVRADGVYPCSPSSLYTFHTGLRRPWPGDCHMNEVPPNWGSFASPASASHSNLHQVICVCCSASPRRGRKERDTAHTLVLEDTRY